MAQNKWLVGAAALATAASLFAQKNSTALPPVGSETVYSVAHVKPGMEAQYAQSNAKAWALYRKLNLVLPAPHVVVQGVDAQKLPYFVEIFTWRSAEIPDHAPAAVRAVWQELENACEKRDGRPGIDFSEVTAVQVK